MNINGLSPGTGLLQYASFIGAEVGMSEVIEEYNWGSAHLTPTLLKHSYGLAEGTLTFGVNVPDRTLLESAISNVVAAFSDGTNEVGVDLRDEKGFYFIGIVSDTEIKRDNRVQAYITVAMKGRKLLPREEMEITGTSLATADRVTIKGNSKVPCKIQAYISGTGTGQLDFAMMGNSPETGSGTVHLYVNNIPLPASPSKVVIDGETGEIYMRANGENVNMIEHFRCVEQRSGEQTVKYILPQLVGSGSYLMWAKGTNATVSDVTVSYRGRLI